MPENRLARETSPYLLQHKDNPVQWWPWGPEALAEAQRTGRPILLSVGYAACHWCHVMAHESFEDPATAAVMNALFVNIKVDREERPDVDHLYMSALHALGEPGGWPLTMFLTPGGAPVWGGTYFPKVARYGRPSFVEICREIARVFEEEPERVASNAAAIGRALLTRRAATDAVDLGRRELDEVARQIAALFDPELGGPRTAPKFPQAPVLELLWRAGLRTGDDTLFAPVETTLTRMSQGGIWDHLGGGFARYSVDARWHVPHFEKMLYDNAQLLALLALAHARTGDPLYRDRATGIVAWLDREMTMAEGAFAASLDADSEGAEGKFYTWTLDEILGHLGPGDGALFAAAYGVTAAGNWEGTNVLHQLDAPDLSESNRIRLESLRATLLAVRNRRPRPGLDDKILADWNGLTIAALADAGALLAEPGWIDRAARAFQFVAGTMTRGDRLGHAWRAGRLTVPGLASDHAMMIKAALALHEATGEPAYLDRAQAWQAALDDHHLAPDGSYFLAADDAEAVVLRLRPSEDDATPNAQGITAQNLIRLSVLTSEDRYREQADRLITALSPLAAANLFAHAALLNAIDLRLHAAEIVCVGPDNAAFAAAALQLPFLNRIVLRAPAATALPARHPARSLAADGGTVALVCAGERCSLPVTTPEQLAAAAARPMAAAAL
jgi:uncharacterized protein YyaL (SSP411 family)